MPIDFGPLGVTRGASPRADAGPAAEGASIAHELAPWSVAVLCAALALAALWHIARLPDPEALPVVRFEFRPVAGSWFDRRAPALAVAPDATTIAWSACEPATSTCGLYVRRLDRLDATRLGGTDGAEAPFFSPDGRWLGFFADGKLKKVSVAGGSAITLADAPYAGGASWNDDGRIVFAGLPAGGLAIAADQGGEVTPLTTPSIERGELRHAWPAWLPDGSSIVFTIVTSPVAGAPGQLAVLPLPSHEWRTLRAGVTRAVPGGPGYLLLSSGPDLQAVTFDERTLALTGAADSVLSGLATAGGTAQFAVSGGTLVAVRASAAPRTVAWSDTLNRPIAGADRLASMAIAPDGRRAAGVIADANASDIWIADLDRGGLMRLTYGGINVSPAWSHDGRVLYFSSRTREGFQVQARAIAERAPAPPPGPATPQPLFPSSVAADGRIAGTTPHADGHVEIGGAWTFSHGPFDEWAPALSPDDQWIAGVSDESGHPEVYARSLRDQRRLPVSSGGGERPSWDAAGRAIYFQSGDRLFRAPFDPAAPSPVGAATVIFDRPDTRALAITPGGRILVERQPVMLDGAMVVLQWVRELRRKLPVPISAPR